MLSGEKLLKCCTYITAKERRAMGWLWMPALLCSCKTDYGLSKRICSMLDMLIRVRNLGDMRRKMRNIWQWEESTLNFLAFCSSFQLCYVCQASHRLSALSNYSCTSLSYKSLVRKLWPIGQIHPVIWFLWIKFYWNTPMPICFCILHAWLCTTMAELSSCYRDFMACRA